MLVKIVAVQARMGHRLTLEEKIHIFKQQPDYVCLPEYWLLDGSITDYHRAALHRQEYLNYLHRLSDELRTCLIGGTVVEADGSALYNTAYLFDRGSVIGRYRKRHPVLGEQERGITAGETSAVFDIDGVRIGLMICGDVFFPERYADQREDEVDIIFIPTTSVFRADDSVTQKKERDQRYFVDGAAMAGAYVVKVCGVGSIFGRPLQGRSLIAAPWGVLEQVDFAHEQEKRILSSTLDISEIREFRTKFPHQLESRGTEKL